MRDQSWAVRAVAQPCAGNDDRVWPVLQYEGGFKVRPAPSSCRPCVFHILLTRFSPILVAENDGDMPPTEVPAAQDDFRARL